MASSIDIATYSSPVQISVSTDTFAAFQISSDSALDADVVVKLQQSTSSQLIDIDGTSNTIAAGENTVLIETNNFTLGRLYLSVDVGSATAGTLSVDTSNKKKEISDEVDATIVGAVDVDVTNQVLNETNIDAFNRLRVSQVRSQADLKQVYDELPLFYDIEEIGGGTHTYNGGDSDSSMTTSSTGDMVIMQTKQRFNYSSGKSSLLFWTFRKFDTETNIEKRIGYFNSSITSPYTSSRDGFYLENNEGTIRFVIVKNGSGSAYNQADWDDPMDGTGASGVDLELGIETGNYIMWADYEWLGVGQVRFGFIKDGVFHVANTIDHILGDGVYMLSPNHSIRAEIRQNGPASGGTLRFICATYGSEGEIDSLGKILSDNMGGTHVDANSTSNTYALMGIKLGTSYFDTLVDVLGFTILAITNDNQRWELWLNPTVSGTFTYSAVSNSSVETAKGSGTGNTVTTTGATLLDSGYIAASSSNRFSIDSAIRLGATIAGVADEIVLCTTPLSSNSDVIASLTWRELS